jgi:hypothetical protein
VADIDTDEDSTIEQSELEALTVAQLRAFAEDQSITLTATKKADIIAEILAALNPAEEDNEQTPGD